MNSSTATAILLVAAAGVGFGLFYSADSHLADKKAQPEQAQLETTAATDTVSAEAETMTAGDADVVTTHVPFDNLSAPANKAALLQPRPGDHVMGAENAPVTVVEYASLSCSHCADFHTGTFPALQQKYIDTGKVRFIYRHYPFNAPALRGAMVAECSGDDFFKFLKVLFNTQPKWAYTGDYQNALKSLAGVGGMSAETFDACMQNQELEQQLTQKMQWGSQFLNIESTPSFAVGNRVISGNRNIIEFSKIIDAELAKKGAE